MRAIVVAAAFLALASSASAATGRLVVDPHKPVVGARTLIELRTAAKGPLALQLTSPTGVQWRMTLVRVKRGIWRAGFHFSDDGRWTLRVPSVRAVANVLVLQNGAALPPSKPNGAGSIATGGVVFGR